MIYSAKVQFPVYRFMSERGEALKLKINIDGVDVLACAYEKDFPIGLFAYGGPLKKGSFIDVVFADNPDGRDYEVVAWGNQHDAIKAFVVAKIVTTQSAKLVKAIPFIKSSSDFDHNIEDLQNKKANLEEILNLKNPDKFLTDEIIFEFEDFEVDADSEELSDE